MIWEKKKIQRRPLALNHAPVAMCLVNWLIIYLKCLLYSPFFGYNILNLKNIAIINFETLKKNLVPRFDHAEEPCIAGNVMILIRAKSEDKLVV